jgi:hypothetical protein
MLMMKNKVVVWPSVMSEGLVQSVDKKGMNDGATVSELLCEFPQISHTFLYKIFTVRVGYQKLCASLVRKMVTSASALTF